MTDSVHNDTSRRHDFVILFEVTDGNPNGDPDAGNLPRVDPETMQGLVTDVALKRKVRDYVDAVSGEESRFKIHVQSGVVLNAQHKRAYDALGLEPSKKPSQDAQGWMCDNFYDIRLFGAVMSTGDHNCGQVRGPIQMTFARSIDPIIPLDLAITRVAYTKEDEVDKPGSQMGRKPLVPYGLYKGFGFFNPHFAEQTGANDEDMSLFWQALTGMWDLDRSAARGMMACRGLYVFSHDSKLGNAPAHTLFERVEVASKRDVAAPRSFRDYTVDLDESDMPDGVSLTRLVG